MRGLGVLCALLASVSAWAKGFDSAAWLEKRALFAQEAERLRAAYSNHVARATSPAEDVTLTLETFDDGSVRTSVVAGRAQFFPRSGYVWAENLSVVKVDEDGREVSRLEADRCVIDRVTKSGWVEGRAKLRDGRTVFTGEGVFFSSREGYVSVYRNSDLVSQDIKAGVLK